MVDDGEPLPTCLGPDRLHVRVVYRVVERQTRLRRNRPGRVRPTPHLSNRSLDVSSSDLQYRREPAGMPSADFVQVAVERPDERHVDFGVLVRPESAADEELRIDAFLVHLLDPFVDQVVLDADRRVDTAHELLEAALLALSRPGLAEMAGLPLTPPLAAVAEPVPVLERLGELLPRPAGLHRTLERLELRQPLAVGRFEVLRDRLGRRLEMGVHVPNTVACSHSALPRRQHRRCPTPAMILRSVGAVQQRRACARRVRLPGIIHPPSSAGEG